MEDTARSHQRGIALRTFEQEPADVVVIGGGIVGAGVARDAAMRGLRTLLLEQHDFASGTSSRSSRLLHGGLRYLAQGHIGLVREASREKLIIQKIAPHLVAPLAFVFPARKGGEYPLWQLTVGVKMYDLLCGTGNFEPSRKLSVEETLGRAPGLRREGLKGAARYFDALTNDARLVIDTLKSAEEHGAALFNYTPCTKPQRAGEGWEVEAAGVTVKTRCVVNAAGAWADRLAGSSVRLRLTKGVHLVVPRKRMPVEDAVVLGRGDRILFVIPWGTHTILGTTDTDYEGDPAMVSTEREDVEYVLSVVNEGFPDAALRSEDVVSTWAGVRPLIAAGESAGAPSDISRRHEIRHPAPGWFDVAGGKLTTYRLMAEQTVDRVVEALGRRAQECRTAETPLRKEAPEWSRVLPPAIGRETARKIAREEWVVRPEDLLIRRTSWAYVEPDAERILGPASEWMAESR